VVALGLLPIVADLAALCPDPTKRSALLATHRAFLSSAAATDQARLGRGWLPPEAGLVAASRAEQQASWSCERCTLMNAPAAARCEVCGGQRPKAGPAAAPASPAPAAVVANGAPSGRPPTPPGAGQWGKAAGGKQGPGSQQQQPQQQQSQRAPAADAFPSLGGGSRGGGSGAAPGASRSSGPPSAAAASSSSSAAAAPQVHAPASAAEAAALVAAQAAAGGGGKGKKGKKQSLAELMAAGKTAPSNAWSQQSRLSKAIGGANDAWQK
jgi:hypothetical protein